MGAGFSDRAEGDWCFCGNPSSVEEEDELPYCPPDEDQPYYDDEEAVLSETLRGGVGNGTLQGLDKLDPNLFGSVSFKDRKGDGEGSPFSYGSMSPTSPMSRTTVTPSPTRRSRRASPSRGGNRDATDATITKTSRQLAKTSLSPRGSPRVAGASVEHESRRRRVLTAGTTTSPRGRVVRGEQRRGQQAEEGGQQVVREGRDRIRRRGGSAPREKLPSWTTGRRQAGRSPLRRQSSTDALEQRRHEEEEEEKEEKEEEERRRREKVDKSRDKMISKFVEVLGGTGLRVQRHPPGTSHSRRKKRFCVLKYDSDTQCLTWKTKRFIVESQHALLLTDIRLLETDAGVAWITTHKLQVGFQPAKEEDAKFLVKCLRILKKRQGSQAQARY